MPLLGHQQASDALLIGRGDHDKGVGVQLGWPVHDDVGPWVEGAGDVLNLGLLVVVNSDSSLSGTRLRHKVWWYDVVSRNTVVVGVAVVAVADGFRWHSLSVGKLQEVTHGALLLSGREVGGGVVGHVLQPCVLVSSDHARKQLMLKASLDVSRERERSDGLGHGSGIREVIADADGVLLVVSQSQEAMPLVLGGLTPVEANPAISHLPEAKLSPCWVANTGGKVWSVECLRCGREGGIGDRYTVYLPVPHLWEEVNWGTALLIGSGDKALDLRKGYEGLSLE
jgi:hypothetical protein